MKTKIQINAIDGSVLFEYECENNSIHKTLEQLVKQRDNFLGSYSQWGWLMLVYLRGIDFEKSQIIKP